MKKLFLFLMFAMLMLTSCSKKVVYIPVDKTGKIIQNKSLSGLSTDECILIYVACVQSGVDPKCGDKLSYCVVQGEWPD